MPPIPAARGHVPADERHLSSIQRSHARCRALGLDRGERPDPDPATRADVALVRERNSRLFIHAAPVMELLYEQIVDTESMVLLTDTSGMILHSIGDHDFLERASKVALSPGVNWDERSKGTNAIGTAIINQSPTLVHANEHFIRANHFLTCSAAPIFDPRGNILGVLDVTGDHRSYHRHTMGLVKMSAQMVENHWLGEDFRNALRLHFHSRPEFIGTLLEGIIAIGHDGRVARSNRSALDQLGISGATLRTQSLTALFGITVGALVDHFRCATRDAAASRDSHRTPLRRQRPLQLAGVARNRDAGRAFRGSLDRLARAFSRSGRSARGAFGRTGSAAHGRLADRKRDREGHAHPEP